MDLANFSKLGQAVCVVSLLTCLMLLMGSLIMCVESVRLKRGIDKQSLWLPAWVNWISTNPPHVGTPSIFSPPTTKWYNAALKCLYRSYQRLGENIQCSLPASLMTIKYYEKERYIVCKRCVNMRLFHGKVQKEDMWDWVLLRARENALHERQIHVSENYFHLRDDVRAEGPSLCEGTLDSQTSAKCRLRTLPT